MSTENDRLIYLVFTAQKKLRTYLNGNLAADGVKATITQAGILFLLRHQDGRTMTELSQIMGLDNSTITGLIDRMEKSGFVTRNSNPSDRRLSHIFITPKGQEEASKAKTVIRRVNEEVKKGFSSAEIDTFKGVLNSFFKKFNSGK